MTDQTPINTQNARPLTPIQSIAQTLDSEAFAPKIAASLDGTGISPERFKRAALAYLSRPEAVWTVERCDRASIYTAIMNAAAAGLELHPALGQAYIVPRKDQAVLQVGYKGYIALASRAGIAVEADVIYAGDKYRVVKGMNPTVEVEPEFDPAKRGEWVAVYVITHYASGAKTLTFMTRAEIEKLRDKFSDAWNQRGKDKRTGKEYGPGEGPGAKAWRETPEEMAKKTAIRRASKLWPISVPGGSDDEGETLDASVVDPVPAPRRGEAARDITPKAGGDHLDALGSMM